MFKLLNLTCSTYNEQDATRNYKDILSVIHPDKNHSSEAALVTSAVIFAYNTLKDRNKREHYMIHGKPSRYEPYDNAEASRYADIMNNLILENKRETLRQEQERMRLIRERSRQERETEDTETRENRAELDSFQVFLQQCREAAQKDMNENNGDNISPDSGFDQTEGTTSENRETNKTATQMDTDQPQPGPSGVNLRPRVHPEVIFIDSDSDSETSFEEPVNMREYFNLPNFVDTDDEERNKPPPTYEEATRDDTIEYEYEYEEEVEEEEIQPTTQDMSTSPYRVETNDMATSPLRVETKDMATSPIRFEEDLPNLTSTARRNLDFSEHLNSSNGNEMGTSRNSGTSNGSGSFQQQSRFKQYITELSNMRTRDGVTSFKVKWGPGGHERRELASVVISERKALKNWLEALNVENPRKYSAVLKYHPEFTAVLDN